MDVISQGDSPSAIQSEKVPEYSYSTLISLDGRTGGNPHKLSDDYRHIPIAILTTSSSQAEREFCLSAGASHFLTKPSTVDGFNQTIETILKIAMHGQHIE